MKVKEESENVCLKLNIQKTKIITSGPITLWQIDGETLEAVTDYIFFLWGWGDSKSLQMVTAAMKLKDTGSLNGRYDQPKQFIKKQIHYFAKNGPSSQSSGLSSSHVWI